MQPIYRRPEIEERFWRRLQDGKHLLIPGPRRIGKTTLLKQALKEPRPGFHPVYAFVESVDSVGEYYRKLLSTLLDGEFVGSLQRLSQRVGQQLKTLRVEEIGGKVRFGAPGEVDYRAELRNFVTGLDLDGPIVMLVDEFPQAVENITAAASAQQAIALLQGEREIRHDPALSGRLQFVYAGSIGLENVVAGLGASKHINDLVPVQVPPLTWEEGLEFLGREFDRREVETTAESREYLLERIGRDWLIPHFIREFADELPSARVSEAAIDRALDQLLGRQNLFEHWHGRLRMALPPKELLFVKAVLNTAADPQCPWIDSKTITNLAVEHDQLERQAHLLGILKHDGYLNNQQSAAVYRFNSPIIRLWWWRNIAN